VFKNVQKIICVKEEKEELKNDPQNSITYYNIIKNTKKKKVYKIWIFVPLSSIPRKKNIIPT